MTRLMILVTSLSLLSGCAGLKGTMLDGRLCTLATQAERGSLTEQVLNTYVSEKDRESAKSHIAVGKLGATVLCEMLRDRESKVAAGQSVETIDIIIK